MAKTIKCKACKNENDKYAKLCRSCGKALYPEISYKNAAIVTILCDIIFTFVYLFGIYLFIKDASNNEINLYTRMLPAPRTFAYFFIIALFIVFAAIKVLYILNLSFFKKSFPFRIRRVSMFVESITMFPLQLILALYFYEPATNPNKIPSNVEK